VDEVRSTRQDLLLPRANHRHLMCLCLHGNRNTHQYIEPHICAKTGANDKTRNEGRYSEYGCPAGAKSVITVSTDVAQPWEFVLEIGAIGCLAFGSERCNFISILRS
jgi:hypothetical protein